MSSNSQSFLDDLTRRLQPHGLEPDGIAWVLKALHPAFPSTIEGLPDSSYYKSVRNEYRGQTIVQAPTGTTTTWDLLVQRLPGDTTPVIWYSAPAAASAPVAQGYVNNVPIAVTGATGNSTNPTGSGGPTFNIYAPADSHVAYREAYASLTCYLTASALNDGGTVFASQTSGDPIRAGAATIDTSVAGNALFTGYSFPQVPGDEDEMARLNPRYYTAPARDGVYLPLRLFGPDQPFVPSPSQVFFREEGSAYPLGVTIGGSASSVTTLVQSSTDFLWPSFGAASSDPNFYNSSFSRTSFGLVIFRGLAPQATVTIRSVVGAEYIVQDTSVQAAFARVPPRYDPRAIEAYYRLVHEMPDAYPASWNSLGLLGGAIASLAQRLWPAVRAAAPHLGAALRAGGSAFLGAGTQPSMGKSQGVVTPAPASRLALGASKARKPKKKAKAALRGRAAMR